MDKDGIVKRIVLTGGPCGGKSSVQTMLSDVFSNMGWKVFRVPETASILLGGGVNFGEFTEEQAFQFQKNLLQTMHAIEDTFFKLAQFEAQKGHKALVICDRGSMDASAYIDKIGWKRILTELNMSEVSIRDERYDYVLHLVTAALGAESFYTKDSNSVRSEGIELARKLDIACMNAWTGHPYFDIIDNSSNFDQKCHRVIATLLGRLGLSDRRFGKNIAKFKFKVAEDYVLSDNDFPVEHQDFVVEHTILSNQEHGQVRLRKRTQQGVSHFNITIAGSSEEVRRSLSGREYDNLRSQADTSAAVIVKKRRCFLFANKYFQLDLFESPSKGLMILEAYLTQQNGVDIRQQLPPFIPVAENITGNSNYSLSHLAKN